MLFNIKNKKGAFNFAPFTYFRMAINHHYHHLQPFEKAL